MKKSFILILCFAMLLASFACGKSEKWPDSGLATMLPEPNFGNISYINEGSSGLSVRIENTNDSMFSSYKSQCIESGYTVDVQSDDDNEYEAYNSEGYYLKLYLSKKYLSVDLERPIEMTTLRWPGGTGGSIVPKPESNIGNVDWEHENEFMLYVGNTTLEDYQKYVDKCADAGFSVDYSRHDKSYRASNPDGYRLSLSYKGFNTMSVRLYPPEVEAAAAPTNEPTPEPTEEPVVKETEAPTQQEPSDSTAIDQNTIRPEIKDAIDTYEEFIDEYCAFLEAYDSSNASQVLQYTSFLAKYAELSLKFEAIGDEELTNAEAAYYADVSLRCADKIVKHSIH